MSKTSKAFSREGLKPRAQAAFNAAVAFVLCVGLMVPVYAPAEAYADTTDEVWEDYCQARENGDLDGFSHGDIVVSSAKAEDGVISLEVGQTATIVVSPYQHVQYDGCDSSYSYCPKNCGTGDDCFVVGYGCKCGTSPDLVTATIDAVSADPAVASVSEQIEVSEELSETKAMLGQTNYATLTLTAVAAGETTVSVDVDGLFFWTPASVTYTVQVVEAEAGEEEEEVVTHNLVEVPAVAATCTTDGNRSYYQCSDCGLLFVDADATIRTTLEEETISAFGHDWDYENATWTWSDDYSSATATLVCANDSSHTTEVAATVSSVANADGSTTYTATIVDEDSLDGGEFSASVTVEAAVEEDGGSTDEGSGSDDGTTDEGGADEGGADDGGSATDPEADEGSGSDDGATDDGATDDGAADEGASSDGTADDGTSDDDATDGGSGSDDGATDEGSGGDDDATDDSASSDGATDDSEGDGAGESEDGDVDEGDAESDGADYAYEGEAYFTDVANPDSWYYDEVYALAEAGYVTGVSDTLYGYGQNITRGDFAVIIWRIAGSPEAANDAGFSDVADGKYYTDAINWAYDEGVVTGQSATKYGVSQSISFQDACLILARYATNDGLDGYDTSSLNGFADGSSVSGYAQAGMAYCVDEGIVSGTTDNTIEPATKITRARAAVILARWQNLV